jgi:hypothetical protein
VPPVVQVINALRPKTVEVKITDVTFINVTLEDFENDGKVNNAVVVFSTDGPVDGKVNITVTLCDAEGNSLEIVMLL